MSVYWFLVVWVVLFRWVLFRRRREIFISMAHGTRTHSAQTSSVDEQKIGGLYMQRRKQLKSITWLNLVITF